MQNTDTRMDLIRVIAIFAVIILHSAGPLLYRYNAIDIHWWLIANAFESFTRIGVPLFIMLSGALLLGKNESLITFFLKRMKKVLIPLLVWTLIYLYFLERTIPSLTHFVRSVLSGQAMYHLGFMNIIIGLYFTVPILRKWVNVLTKNEQLYVAVIWFVGISLFPVIGKLGINIGFNPSVVPGFIGYLILGYFLKDIDLNRKNKVLCIVMFAAGCLMTFIGTWELTENAGMLKEGFYEYLSPNIVITSVSAYCLLVNARPKFTWLSKISKNSFGMYFIHPLVLVYLEAGYRGYSLKATTIHPFIGIPMTAITCLFLSYIAIEVLNFIPLKVTKKRITIFG